MSLCYRCGHIKKVTSFKVYVRFLVSDGIRNVNLCSECAISIGPGDRLPYGRLTYNNRIPVTIIAFLEEPEDQRRIREAGHAARLETEAAAERARQAAQAAMARARRIERVRYLRRFRPSNRRWVGGWEGGGITCFGMWISRRRPRLRSDEEVAILRGLKDDDETGWLIYADWLDDHGETGNETWILLSEKIRRHVNVQVSQRLRADRRPSARRVSPATTDLQEASS